MSSQADECCVSQEIASLADLREYVQESRISSLSTGKSSRRTSQRRLELRLLS